MVNLIFCADPLNPTQPDPDYQREVEIAQLAKLPIALLDFEAWMYAGDSDKALHQIPSLERETLAIYRGWMLTPELYHDLYLALLAKNWRLINTPAQYQHAHYLPEVYPTIREQTPRTVWMETGVEVPMGDVMVLLELFGKRPVIVRDYAKSQKHYWKEACYIRSASDGDGVARVVKRFVELQGEELNKGLVFREFIQLEPLGTLHAKSELPLYKEYRSFWLDGQPMYTLPYWKPDWYGGDTPPIEEFWSVARQVNSRFFTMDFAKKLNSDWIIMEIGDGQVSGLADHADLKFFYKQLGKL